VVKILVAGGGTMIDTSPMYGRSEGVVGDIVAGLGLRQQVFLATKVWISGRDQGIAQMQRSAQLLKSPVIDLMQIHNLVDWRTQLATMRDMKADGQLRYIGITHYTVGALPELARILEARTGSILSNAAIRSKPASRRRGCCRSRRARGRGHRQPAVRAGRPVPQGARQSAARLGRRVRLRELGAAVLEISARRPGGDGGDPGDQQARPHGGQFKGRLRPPPRPKQREQIRRLWDSL
jgi:aryl-alcohol dehydrogenase-like predicted oxidoreductase